MLSSLPEIKMLSSLPEIKRYIDLFLKEILNNVAQEEILNNVVQENVRINIHINPFYKIKDEGIDYPRQAFIYFTLSRLLSFLKENNCTELIKMHSLDEIINKISINIKYNYDKEIDGVNRKFIELYSLRACLFNNDNDDQNHNNNNNNNQYTYWIDNFKKENINLIYTHPILLNLYLNTLKDIHTMNIIENEAGDMLEIDLANYHLPSAVEAYYNLIKVRKDINKEAYNYTDMYYFNGIKYFNNDYYKAADEFIKEQLLIDDKNMDTLNTSTIAKLFEGFCNKSYNNIKDQTKAKIDDEIQKYFDIVMSRKIKLDTRLIKNFKYTENSISEIKNTSYVCLDTYAHLLLGLIPLFSLKQLDEQVEQRLGKELDKQNKGLDTQPYK